MPSKPEVHSQEGFREIGTGIYLREIHEQGHDKSPDVILIFGWMGAQLRHMQDCIRTYTKLYPNASQIIVQCNSDLFWIAPGTKQQRLIPAIDALEALHCLPTSSPGLGSPRILTHVFSSGGSLQMALLGDMLRQKYGSALGSWSFTSALILDSCPAAGTLKSIKVVFDTLIRNLVIRYIVLAFVYTGQFITLGLSLLFGKRILFMENIQTDMWNPHVLPWMGLHTPRLYIFSRKDKLTPWQGVIDHAETAKERGMNVRCELFEGSGHVGHRRAEPERYWSSVQEVWGVAISKEKRENWIYNRL